MVAKDSSPSSSSAWKAAHPSSKPNQLMPLKATGWPLATIWPPDVLSVVPLDSMAPPLGGGGGAGAATLTWQGLPALQRQDALT